MAAGDPPVGAGRTMQVAVVAERADRDGNALMVGPVHCAIYDAGCIEIGGGTPAEPAPAPAAMARAIQTTLASAGYVPAPAATPPSLLIVCHWGLLRRNPVQVRTTFRLDPNLRARLALVAPRQQVGEMENFFLDRLEGRTDPAFAVPGFLSLPARRVLDLVRDDRCFAIVSAYEHAAFSRHEIRRVWRVIMSAAQSGGTMAEILPALLQGGGAWLGRHSETTLLFDVPVGPLSPEDAGKMKPGAALSSSAAADPAAAADLRRLIEQEYREFSWPRPASGREETHQP
jgi:hypothetical protein